MWIFREEKAIRKPEFLQPGVWHLPYEFRPGGSDGIRFPCWEAWRKTLLGWSPDDIFDRRLGRHYSGRRCWPASRSGIEDFLVGARRHFKVKFVTGTLIGIWLATSTSAGPFGWLLVAHTLAVFAREMGSLGKAQSEKYLSKKFPNG